MQSENFAERLANQAHQLGRSRSHDDSLDGHAMMLGNPLGQFRTAWLGILVGLVDRPTRGLDRGRGRS